MAKFKVILTIILAVALSFSVMAICLQPIKGNVSNYEARKAEAKVLQSKIKALVFGQK